MPTHFGQIGHLLRTQSECAVFLLVVLKSWGYFLGEGTGRAGRSEYHRVGQKIELFWLHSWSAGASASIRRQGMSGLRWWEWKVLKFKSTRLGNLKNSKLHAWKVLRAAMKVWKIKNFVLWKSQYSNLRALKVSAVKNASLANLENVCMHSCSFTFFKKWQLFVDIFEKWQLIVDIFEKWQLFVYIV